MIIVPPHRAVARRYLRKASVLAGGVLMAVVLSACSSQSVSLSPAPTTEPEPSTTTIVPTTWPLTGVEAPSISAIERSAVAAKIDNEPAARPHTAVKSADVVFEVWVEGITRFAAVFHSDVPERVGPVRSGRSTDVDLLANLGRPIIVFSGGNPNVNREIGEAADEGLLINGSVDRQPDFYQRDNSRRAPNNLYANPRGLRDAIGEKGGKAGVKFPAPLFSYRAKGEEPTTGDAVPGISIAFGPGQSVQFVWDAEAGCNRRFQDGKPFVERTDEGENGDAPVICPRNVVVQFTPYGPSTADSRSPQAYTVGEGPGLVYTGGRLATVTWDRPTQADGPNLKLEDGTPALLTQGQTWVAMPPEDQATSALAAQAATRLLEGTSEDGD